MSRSVAASLQKLASRLERIYEADEKPSVESRSLLQAAAVLRNMADEELDPHPDR